MTRFTHQLSPKIAQTISIAVDNLGLVHIYGRIDWIFEDCDTDSFLPFIFISQDGGSRLHDGTCHVTSPQSIASREISCVNHAFYRGRHLSN